MRLRTRIDVYSREFIAILFALENAEPKFYYRDSKQKTL